MKKQKIITLLLIFIVMTGLLCSCGGNSANEEPGNEVTTESIADGDVSADAEGTDTAITEPTQKKTGTEDPAIDAVIAAAYEDIEGYDGKWTNMEVDVDDHITTIEFDWNGSHYKYQYDQNTGELIK